MTAPPGYGVTGRPGDGVTGRPGDGPATVGWMQPLIAMHATKEPTPCRYETS